MAHMPPPIDMIILTFGEGNKVQSSSFSYPYKTTGKSYIFSQILILTFFDMEITFHINDMLITHSIAKCHTYLIKG
jgi:hypothetical protein